MGLRNNVVQRVGVGGGRGWLRLDCDVKVTQDAPRHLASPV